MNETILEAKNITKYFHDPVTVKVLTDINFSIKKGRFCFCYRKVGLWKIYVVVYFINHGYRL
jgi:lipoprotein-releasing system ATP-binding protein